MYIIMIGGFQAGESRTIRKLARAVIAEFQHFIKAERQYCLELAPDQGRRNTTCRLCLRTCCMHLVSGASSFRY
jgi:hypothetical protein|eukprot:COSAG01_NODE_5764_length_4047_cov_3.196302_4_plen_74_part_00